MSPFRRNEHSPAEWEARRGVIAGLHASPYLTLEDLISIMATEHAFPATKTMFKRYLRSWGLSKKVIIDKRHELAKVALAHLQVGRELPLVDSQGHSIPWARVKRHFLRKGEDPTIWRYIQIPQQQKPKSSQLEPVTDEVNTGEDPDSPPGATPSSSSSSSSSSSASSLSPEVDGSLSASSLSPPASSTWEKRSSGKSKQRSRHAFSQYRPRSPSIEVDKILYYIGNFQEWRAITVPQALTPSEVTQPGDKTAPLSIAMGNVAREDAALNVSNTCIDVYQNIVLEKWDDAGSGVKSALRHFDSHLTDPSLFLLYSVLSTYLMTIQGDTVVLAYVRTFFMQCRYSSSEHLGAAHPMTQILAQLLAVSQGNLLSDWSIAILDCIAHTRDHLTSEAARFTSLKMKNGLAWALLDRGYPFSAISILEEIITETSALKHPVLRKTAWLRSRLAGIYRQQGLETAARSVLEEAFAISPGVVDDGILHCSSSLAQLQENSGQMQDAQHTYRQLYESACQIHGRRGPTTMLYARIYFDFLKRNGMEVLKERFKEEFEGIDNVDLRLLQQHQWEFYAKYITLGDAGFA
ncbi:hypothetical protein BX600DRAFT_518653 [Xylariales sp. PMI_506]|nr:hypothetical protein BX600DRAFT_518653 [Xylariales sp. PMI_506]